MTRRRPAFDPSRLDDIDELLPPTPIPTPPPARPTPGADAVGTDTADTADSANTTEATDAAGAAAAAESRTGDGREPGGLGTAPPGSTAREVPAPVTGERGRVARGAGGRPPAPRGVEQLDRAVDGAVDGQAARVQVAVRIAHALYEEVTARLLAGPERPSYGQLVVWTCEDHPEAVVDQVVAARPGAGSRRPRGRRLAAESVQVTLRLTLIERSRLDALADRVRQIEPGRVTRTEIAAAALRIALDHL